MGTTYPLSLLNGILTIVLQDLIMDWSLLRKNSKHFLLRAELGFKESDSIYYGSFSLDCDSPDHKADFVWM